MQGRRSMKSGCQATIERVIATLMRVATRFDDYLGAQLVHPGADPEVQAVRDPLDLWTVSTRHAKTSTGMRKSRIPEEVRDIQEHGYHGSGPEALVGKLPDSPEGPRRDSRGMSALTARSCLFQCRP